MFKFCSWDNGMFDCYVLLLDITNYNFSLKKNNVSINQLI